MPRSFSRYYLYCVSHRFPPLFIFLYIESYKIQYKKYHPGLSNRYQFLYGASFWAPKYFRVNFEYFWPLFGYHPFRKIFEERQIDILRNIHILTFKVDNKTIPIHEDIGQFFIIKRPSAIITHHEKKYLNCSGIRVNI